MMVKLHDGTKFVDEFVDNSSKHVIFKEQGRIRRDAIKKMFPYHEEAPVWITPRSPEEIDANQAKEFPNLCPLRQWKHHAPNYDERGDARYSGGYWETCRRPLSAEGACEEHGQVRFSPYDTPKERQERRDAQKEIKLRKEPPRRAPGGKTTARMMHVRKRHGW